WVLFGSSTINASGAGFPAQTDSASLSFSHQLDGYTTFTADAVYTDADSVGALVPARTRSESYAARVARQLDREWTFEVGARFARYRLQNEQAPQSASVFFGLRRQLPEPRL